MYVFAIFPWHGRLNRCFQAPDNVGDARRRRAMRFQGAERQASCRAPSPIESSSLGYSLALTVSAIVISWWFQL